MRLHRGEARRARTTIVAETTGAEVAHGFDIGVHPVHRIRERCQTNNVVEVGKP